MKAHKQFHTPHFIIVGAAKSGTTTLYDDLACHPDACMPSNKEPDVLHLAKSSQAALHLWSRHFSKAQEGQLLGEASTKYSMVPEFPSVADFAREVAGPDLRIIYLMRNPITRIESHLAHDRAVGRLDGISDNVAALLFSRYVSWSDYPRQIKPWITAFGHSQVKCVVFEDLISDREVTVRDVAAFIGFDPSGVGVRADVSNERGSIKRFRMNSLGQFVNSHFYRHYLRRAMPDGLRRFGRGTLLVKQQTSDVKLHSDTYSELNNKLAHVVPELLSMGIGPGRW